MPNIYKANFFEDENRGEKKNPPPKKKKPNFKNMKNNTVKSLNDVEYFLNNFGNFVKYVKLYKLLK